jgi:transcription-repair coupling factor (superfamily II helicase)
LYRRLGTIENQEELDSIREEMRDRFGPLPKEVENLLEVLGLRLRAMACGVEAIVLDRLRGVIEVLFHRSMFRDERWKRIGDMVHRAHLKPHPRGFVVPAQQDPEKVMGQVRHVIGELEKACLSATKKSDATVRTGA